MKEIKCACGERAVYEDDLKFNSYQISGWVCKTCGETYYDPEKAEKILLLNRLKKTKHHVRLGQVKSNLILRIPKDVGEALNLKKGAEMDVEVKDADEILIQRHKANT